MSDSSAAATTRPSDDEILTQEREIFREIATQQSLVSPRLAIESLIVEYEGGSAVIREKAKALVSKASHIRRLRGDGNCFYRAFAVKLLELLRPSANDNTSASPSNDSEWREQLRERCATSDKLLRAAGYDPMTFEDFFFAFRTLLYLPGQQPAEFTEAAESSYISPADIPASIDEAMNTDFVSDAVVVHLRLLTAAWLKTHREEYEPFIEGGDVDLYCSMHVEAMSKECDHVNIIALVNALQIPVHVYYLDNSLAHGIVDVKSAAGDGPLEATVHEFTPNQLDAEAAVAVSDASAAAAAPAISLLYKPGHYDILYIR